MVAVIVAVPEFVAVILPLVIGDPLLTTNTTLVFEEVQLACPVTSSVVPSENTAVAVNFNFPFAGKVGLAGVTMIEVRVAPVAVIVVEPETPLRVAVIAVFPTARPVTSPEVPNALLTCAIVLSPEVQLTRLVQFGVLPSLKVQVAVRSTAVPLAIEGLTGVTAIEVRVSAVTVTVVEPETPP